MRTPGRAATMLYTVVYYFYRIELSVLCGQLIQFGIIDGDHELESGLTQRSLTALKLGMRNWLLRMHVLLASVGDISDEIESSRRVARDLNPLNANKAVARRDPMRLFAATDEQKEERDKA